MEKKRGRTLLGYCIPEEGPGLFPNSRVNSNGRSEEGRFVYGLRGSTGDGARSRSELRFSSRIGPQKSVILFQRCDGSVDN